ncbi:MAG: phage integrase SAM-like domain-containing protein [Bacteroidota bacterium]
MIMPASVKVVLFKNRPNANGECPLAIRISKERRSAYISLGMASREENWNSSKEGFRRSRETPLYKKWNEQIRMKREEIRLRIFELEAENPGISAKELKEILNKPEGKSFLEYVRAQAREAFERRDLKRWEQIEQLEKRLVIYLQHKDLKFDEVDFRFVRAFMEFLIGPDEEEWTAREMIATMRDLYGQAVEENPDQQQEDDPFFGLDLDHDFLKFIRDRMEQLLQEDRFRTYERHRTLLKHLGDFLSELDQDTLPFQNINARFLRQFEAYLIRVPLKVNSRHTYLKTFRTCLYEAIREGLFPQELNPFFKFKLKKEKVRKPKLSLQEISQIEELNLEPGSAIWHTRNAFLFMYYCAGMRVGDLLQLRWVNVHQGRLRYKMEKTGKEHGPKLIDPAMAIVNLYRNPLARPNDFVFPFLSNELDPADVVLMKKQVSAKTAKLNEHLKTIGAMIGLSFRLTNHIARHSFTKTVQSRDAKELGIGVHDIQGALAHSSVSITENYLEELNDDQLDHVMNGFHEILKRNKATGSDESDSD